MLVEFLKDWRDANKGDRRDVADEVAEQWINRKIAKSLDAPPKNKAIKKPKGKKAVSIGG